MPISADYMLQITAAYARALRYGLVEIRDLQDEHGEPMPLPVPDFIRGAPGSIIQELGQELMRISRLSETERKNFSAPREPGRAAATAASARAKTRSPATAT